MRIGRSANKVLHRLFWFALRFLAFPLSGIGVEPDALQLADLNPHRVAWNQARETVARIAKEYNQAVVAKSLLDDRLAQLARGLDYARLDGRAIEGLVRQHAELGRKGKEIEKMLANLKEEALPPLYQIMLVEDFLGLDEWDATARTEAGVAQASGLQAALAKAGVTAVWLKVEMLNNSGVANETPSNVLTGLTVRARGKEWTGQFAGGELGQRAIVINESAAFPREGGVAIHGAKARPVSVQYYLRFEFSRPVDKVDVSLDGTAKPGLGGVNLIFLRGMAERTDPANVNAALAATSKALSQIERLQLEMAGYETAVEALYLEAMARLGIQKESIPESARKPATITPKGKPSRILIGSYTTREPEALELLGLDFGAVGSWELKEDGEIPKAATTDPRRSEPRNFATLVELPHNGMLMPTASWWLKAHTNDPGILMENAAGWHGFEGDPLAKAPNAPFVQVPLNPRHPAVREHAAALVRANAREYRDWDNLLGTIIGGEAGMHLVGKGAHQPGHSPAEKQAFRDYLRKKFGDIRKLNAVWRANYVGFESIEPPPDINSLERKFKVTPLSFEFQSFLRDTFAEWHQFLAGQIREVDPRRPVLYWGGDGVSYMNTETRFASDVWKTVQALDVVEMHANTDEREECERLYQYWIARLAGKGNWQFEYIWPWPRPNTIMDEDELAYLAAGQHSVWMHLGWGQQMMSLFLYCGSMKDLGWSGCPWYMDSAFDVRYYFGKHETRTKVVNPLRIFRRSAGFIPVIRRYAAKLSDILLNTEVVRPPLAMIQPSTATANDFYFRHFIGWASLEAEQIHRFLYHRNHDYSYLPEEVIGSGQEKLDAYRLLVLPGGMYFPEGLSDKLLVWIKAGGTLVAAFPPGLYNAHGFADGKLMREVFGAFTEERDWERDRWRIELPTAADQQKEGWLDKRCGRGRVVVYLRSLAEQSEVGGRMRQHFQTVVAETVGAPVAWSEGGVFETITRAPADHDDRRYVMALNWDYHHETTGTLHFKGNWREVVDLGLSGGMRVPATVAGAETLVQLRLPAGGGTLLRLSGVGVAPEGADPARRKVRATATNIQDGLEQRLTRVRGGVGKLGEDRGRKAMALRLADLYTKRGDVDRAITVLERTAFWLEEFRGRPLPTRTIPAADDLKVGRSAVPLSFDGWQAWPRPAPAVCVRTKDGQKKAELLHLGRDAEGLSLAVRVDDDAVLNPHVGRDLQAGDAVIFYFDLLNDAWNYWWGTAHYKYVFGANEKVWAVQVIGNCSAKIMEIPQVTGATGRWLKEKDGYVLLARIPAQELGLPVKNETAEIGFDLAVTDADDANHPHGGAVYTSWQANQAPSQSHSENAYLKRWGQITVGPSAK